MHVYKKKNFFLQNFSDFWVFLKFRSMVAKSETGTWFFRIFRTFWHLYWPWVCIHMEMGNLEAKTPCVLQMSYSRYIGLKSDGALMAPPCFDFSKSSKMKTHFFKSPSGKGLRINVLCCIWRTAQRWQSLIAKFLCRERIFLFQDLDCLVKVW